MVFIRGWWLFDDMIWHWIINTNGSSQKAGMYRFLGTREYRG